MSEVIIKIIARAEKDGKAFGLDYIVQDSPQYPLEWVVSYLRSSVSAAINGYDPIMVIQTNGIAEASKETNIKE